MHLPRLKEFRRPADPVSSEPKMTNSFKKLPAEPPQAFGAAQRCLIMAAGRSPAAVAKERGKWVSPARHLQGSRYISEPDALRRHRAPPASPSPAWRGMAPGPRPKTVKRPHEKWEIVDLTRPRGGVR